jgi:hypothetical protein
MKSARTGSKSRPIKVSKSVVELLEESANDDLVVTPPYNEFLNGWDENWDPRVVDRIAEVMKTRQRDRSKSFSGSGAGKCLRRQELAFLGMPVVQTYDPQLRRIFLNGTWTHYRNQATLMQAGILDNIEVTIRKDSKRARCTMDGMGVALQGRYQGAEFGYELKSANEFSYQSQVTKGVNESTRAQVDFEFLLSGFDIFVIFNENKNNQSIREWVIVRDEQRVRDRAKEIADLNYAIDRERLHTMLPECQKRRRSGEFYKCPFGGDGGVCASVGKWPNRIPV